MDNFFNHTIIILDGDFNKLSDDFLLARNAVYS